jgi:V-type H+-transporting ATPase subunit a
LRLWALSLAHSQLALVFFQKTLGMATTEHWWLNAIILTIIFPAFSAVTTVVLLFMDMMECFLHTLRLHWVEFQNKFYRADGYQFVPFSFSQNLSLNEDEFTD